MSDMTFEDIRSDLEKRLKPTRYDHTLSVMFTAASLAMRWHAEVSEALLAGLLHDCTKSLSFEEHLELIKRESAPVSDCEMSNEKLLHAVTGPIYAKMVYGVDDQQILDAVRWHTTGRADMTLLEKIIYVADYIEPLRRPLPDIDSIRSLAFTDLDRCVAVIAGACINYLTQINSAIEPRTLETYKFYSKKEDYECQN